MLAYPVLPTWHLFTAQSVLDGLPGGGAPEMAGCYHILEEDLAMMPCKMSSGKLRGLSKTQFQAHNKLPFSVTAIESSADVLPAFCARRPAVDQSRAQAPCTAESWACGLVQAGAGADSDSDNQLASTTRR